MNRRGQTCPIKGHRRVYFSRLDMFACLACDAWLSNVCSCGPSDGCMFPKPPRDPSMVTDEPEFM